MKRPVVLTTIIWLGASVTQAQQPLSLQDALSQAMQHNPRLQAIQARRDAVSSRARATSAMLKPQISVTGWLSQGTLDNMLFSSPGVMPDSMRMASRDNFGSTQLKLAFPLFTGGRLQSIAQAAHAERNALSAEAEEMQQEVRLEVTDRYLIAILRRQLVEVAEKRYRAQQEQTRIMQQMYEVGKVPLSFVLRSRAAEAEALQALTTARNEAQKSLLDLQVSMGVDFSTQVQVPATADPSPFVLPATLEEAVQGALQRRALLQSQRFRQQIAQAESKAARGALFPQVYLTASQDWLEQEDIASRSGYTVALTMSIPIWTGGLLQQEVRAANARVREEEANLRSLRLQVENEVRRAWLDVLTAAQNLETARAALQDAEESYRIAVLRVQEGRSPLVEQLDALAALTDARTRVASAGFNHALAQARLLRAMGKL